MSVKIGLYSAGLQKYWEQFEGLKERLIDYGAYIQSRMEEINDVEIYNYGLIDCEEKAKKAGEWFNEKNVSLIFCHVATYVASSSVLPIHQKCKAPVIILSLQPAVQINYSNTSTGEWLAHCNACAVPEICNALNRADIKYQLISGLLGLSKSPSIAIADEVTINRPEAIRAYKEIFQWINAAKTVEILRKSRFGFLGNYYSGMLDIYSDFTMLQATFGIHIEVLEMCDLKKCIDLVKENEKEIIKKNILQFFHISEDSPSDPLVKKPGIEDLDWSAIVAAGMEKLVYEYSLNALSYYYHSRENNEYERIQGAMIVGSSLLTAKHVPCAGEADIKTCIAMKICDILDTGGSFSEIVTTDYINNTILVGHDGPFHIAIAEGKPILRGMALYHGKRGFGVSVEAKVKNGPVTMLGITQAEGGLKMIISEGTATQDEIMKIGNTQTHIRFNASPDEYMEKWFKQAPIHHFALAIGHNGAQFKKIAELLNIKWVEI